MVTINKEFARKVLGVIDAGLVNGLGDPKPGKMCVEAAVAFASGEDHDDHPTCVAPFLADLKISLNDTLSWSSNKARARGLREVAIAQLGSAKVFLTDSRNEKIQEVEEFRRAVLRHAILIFAPIVFSKKFRDNKQVRLTFVQLVQSFGTRGTTGILTSDPTYGSPNPYRVINMSQALTQATHKGKTRKGDAYSKLAADAIRDALIEFKVKGTKYLYLTEKSNRGGKRRGKARRR